METGLKKEDSLALKGLAICLMAFAHCYRKYAKFRQYHVIFYGITAKQAIGIARYCKICVALFAFITGYGLMCSYLRILRKESSQTPAKWTMQHLITTMSGYWFIAPIAYGIYAVFNGNFAKWGGNYFEKIMKILIDILGISELMGTKSLNGSWWYMSAAAAYIILVPFLAVLIEKFGSFACLALVFLLPRCLGIGYQGGNSMYAFLMIMTLGMVCCKHDVFTKIRKCPLRKGLLFEVLWFALLAGLVVFGFLTYRKVDANVLWEYNFVLTPWIVILFCVEFLFRIPGVSKVLQFLGKYSMNIWLTHTFARDWIGEIVYGVRVFWLIPLVLIGIALMVSIVLEYLKKVTGYNRLVQAVLQKVK